MKPRLILIACTLLVAMLACQATSPDSGSSGQPSGGNEQTQNNVLFQDDFTDPASGWDRVNVADGITDYQDGVYRIFVNTANTDVWSNPGLNFSDAILEVDATKISGDDNNDFGLICRYQDTANYYFFIISSDGYYGVGKLLDGQQNLIGSDSMPPSDKINQGNATNHIRAECIGEKLSIHVNNTLLTEVSDNSFTSGDVGLIAGSFDNAGTDIHFDNFLVLQP